MDSMQIRLTPELIRRVDKMVEGGMYSSRNEAIRDAVRKMALEYEALERTREIRKRVAPLIGKKTSRQIIREVRKEMDDDI